MDLVYSNSSKVVRERRVVDAGERMSGAPKSDRDVGGFHRRSSSLRAFSGESSCSLRSHEESLTDYIFRRGDKYIHNLGLSDQKMKSHLFSPPLATAYRGKACRRDPVGSTICPHAEDTVVNCWVVNFLLCSNTLPPTINPIEPDVVGIRNPVVVNIELADFCNQFRWR